MKTKFQLSDIKGMLSRDEMKKVVGGYVMCAYTVYGMAFSGACSGPNAYVCVDYCVNMGYSKCYCVG